MTGQPVGPSLASRRDIRLVAALLFFALLGGLALLAPMLAPQDPARQSLMFRLKPPGSGSGTGTFLLGSDELGRDILSRLLFGLRASLLVAATAALGAGMLGTMAGLSAGWRGRLVDGLVMRIADAFLAIPTLVLAILTLAIVGPGKASLIAVLILARWPRYAYVARAETLRIRHLAFVEAAEIGGASAPRILARHILPNAAAPLIVLFASEIGLMVLFEAGLTFLGLGIQPPEAAIGAMLSSGRTYINQAWWLVVFPGGLLFALVLALNLLADRLRERLSPARAGGQD